MSGTRHALAKNLVAGLCVFFITSLVYSGTFGYGLLQWDDQYHLTENPFIQPDSANRYSYFWVHPYGKLYIPITYNTWGWLYAHSFDGGTFSPHWLRAANIAAHGAAGVLVYFLLLQLLRDEKNQTRLAATMGALFFVLHPLQAESVGWISELRGLLASVLALGAMVFYFREGIWRFILPSVLLTAAFLCKPSVAGVPVLMGVIDLFWIRRRVRDVVMALVFPIALTIAALVLMWNLQGGQTVETVPIALRPLVAGDALAFYLGKVIWPFSLAADYSRTPEYVQRMKWFWFAWMVSVVLVGLGIWWRKRNRMVLTACGVFIAALLPVLGFVPFDFQHISTVADRYAYLALLGPALVVAWVCMRNRIAMGAFALLLVLLGWRSIDQTRSWRDGDALWGHAVAVNRHAVVATSNLAFAMAGRGERESADRLFHHVIELSPNRASGYRGLGRLAADVNNSQTALDWYEQGCAAEPGDAQSHDGAGSMLAALGRFDEAETQFRESVRLDPAFADGWNNLGALLLQRGRIREAKSAFDEALTINPRHPQAMINLANTERASGNDAAADRDLRAAADKLKSNPMPAKLLGKRALARGDWTEAERWFAIATSIDPKDASAVNDLGQALAGEGKLDEAIAMFERAIALRPGSKVLEENLESARKLKGMGGRREPAPPVPR